MKSAIEAHRLLCEYYDEATLSQKSIVVGFISLRTACLTSMTNNITEYRKCTKMEKWKHH